MNRFWHCRGVFALFLSLMFLGQPQSWGMGSSQVEQQAADIMEFWYQKPQPEKIKPMLQGMFANGILNLPENQMLFGAFFSRLLRQGQVKWIDLRGWLPANSPEARHMLAWAAHLSPLPAAELDDSLIGDDNYFATQLHKFPADLRKWPVNEPAILNMFWGAFMADGNPEWLDKVIDRVFAVNQPVAQRNAIATAKAAASSLWKYTRRHPKVEARLRERAEKSSGGDKALLEYLLTNAAQRE